MYLNTSFNLQSIKFHIKGIYKNKMNLLYKTLQHDNKFNQ